MAVLALKSLPPKEQLKYFRAKGYAIGFSWADVWQEEHGVAFTVAKATSVDLLEDVREALDKAQTRGIPFSEFQKNLAPILQAKGWWGRKSMIDPVDGKEKEVQLGSDRRLRTIFDTNMRTAQAAGRWERIQRTAGRRPWLRYVAVQDERTRQRHRDWHGTVLRHDDPFWDTHYPPNGWRCRCIVQQLSDRDMQRFDYVPTAAPEIRTRPWVNPRTGETVDVPAGIDPGFGYNVGKSRLRAFTPPPLGGLPASFPPGVNLPRLPDPSPFPASQILPDGLRDSQYVDAFLKEFGVAPGRPKIFTDVAGEPMVISESLFRAADGTLKVAKHHRHPYMRMLAATIKAPDEIWWIWEESKNKPGTMMLKRRYIGRWKVAGRQEAGIAVFDYGADGWLGTTVFPPAPGTPGRQDRYLDGQRGGTLAWRRQD